jgi:hypothetical protein
VFSYGIAVDASGIYTTGNFFGTVDFDPNAGTSNLTAVASYDIFVSKLNASGNYVWAKSIGGTSFDEGSAIALDATGNVYTIGSFIITADFDPNAGTANLTSAGGSDVFITKLDATGNYVWAKNIGGADQDIATAIAINASANVYTVGTFSREADFDPSAATFNLTSASRNDIFQSKLDATGNFVWANQISSLNINIATGIAVDAVGSVYTVGYYGGTVDFNSSSGTNSLSSSGSNDIFISKLNAAGNYVWAKSIGSAGADVANAITIDGSGNLYIAGYFTDTVDFNPSGTTNLISAGSRDIFVSKWDTAGNLIWAKAMGGTSLDSPESIAVDALGNVYTTGFFRATVDFDPNLGTNNLTSAGISDIFISKLDAAGNFVWAKAMGGTLSDIGNALAIDGSGNVYTSGYFSNTTDFDPGAGTFNLTTIGNVDVFISKLDAAGNFVWAKQMGGVSADVANGMVIDAANNIYTTGYFGANADFDPSSGISNLTSNGAADIFISKLDAAGNYLWAKSMGALSDDISSAISKDALGYIYTTGYFAGTVDFDTDTTTNILTSAGDDDVFITKLDALGNTVWALQLGGTGADNGSAIVLDTARNIYTAGNFSGKADFDPSVGTQNITSIGSNDFFVHKMSQPTSNPSTIDKAYLPFNENINAYPNPANDRLVVKWNNEPNNKRSQIIINDLNGRVVWQSEIFPLSVRETNINLQKIPVGFYTISLVGDGKRASTKLIITR